MTHHLTEFHGHRPCGSSDTMYLICNVTLQDQLIKESCDFVKGSSSLFVTILPSLMVMVIVVY